MTAQTGVKISATVDRAVLSGVVAAAAGMALSMGFKLVGGYLRDPIGLLFGFAAFAAVSIFHLSLPLTVLVLAPIAMAWYWPRGTSVTTPAEEVTSGRRH